MALILYGVLNKDQYDDSDLYYPLWNKIINNNHDNSNQYE